MILLDFVSMALRDIGAYNTGDTLDANEIQDAVSVLNSVADLLNADGLWGYDITRESFTLVSGQAKYTWGKQAYFQTGYFQNNYFSSDGDFASSRPLAVKNCFIRDGGLDYAVDIIGRDEYEDIIDKTTSARPEVLWINFSYPFVECYFYFTPDANYTVFFDSDKDFIDFGDLTSIIKLPGAHIEALRWNFGISLCPSYKRQPTPFMMQQAQNTLRVVERLNAANKAQSVRLQLPTVKPEGTRGNIFTYT